MKTKLEDYNIVFDSLDFDGKIMLWSLMDYTKGIDGPVYLVPLKSDISRFFQDIKDLWQTFDPESDVLFSGSIKFKKVEDCYEIMGISFVKQIRLVSDNGDFYYVPLGNKPVTRVKYEPA